MKGRWERTIGQMMPKVMYERAQEMAFDLPARGPVVSAASGVPGVWSRSVGGWGLGRGVMGGMQVRIWSPLLRWVTVWVPIPFF